MGKAIATPKSVDLTLLDTDTDQTNHGTETHVVHLALCHRHRVRRQ